MRHKETLLCLNRHQPFPTLRNKEKDGEGGNIKNIGLVQLR